MGTPWMWNQIMHPTSVFTQNLSKPNFIPQNSPNERISLLDLFILVLNFLKDMLTGYI